MELFLLYIWAAVGPIAGIMVGAKNAWMGVRLAAIFKFVGVLLNKAWTYLDRRKKN